MDEPTSRLPRDSVTRLFETIRRMRGRGHAVLYVSHFLEEVREIADRFTVLRDGRSVATGDLAGTTDDELLEQMLGRPLGPRLASRRSAGSRAIGEALLEVEALALPPELVSATLTLRRGEILGIAGLVGSGRTALLRCLFGLDRPGRRTHPPSRPRRSDRSPLQRAADPRAASAT